MNDFSSKKSLVVSQNSPSPELVWIHCNKCFELYLKKKRKIFLLSCQHVICESCLQKAEDNKVLCTFCNKSCSYHLLCNDLPYNVKRFFNPQPWKNLENISRVVPFQLKHRKNFLRGLLKAESHVKEYESENFILKRKCKELYIKREKLRKLRSRFEEKILDVRKMANSNKALRSQFSEKKSMQNSTTTVSSLNISNNQRSSGFFSRCTRNDVNFIL